MNHIHILTGENLFYFKCDNIKSITKSHIYAFEYDCSKNTVSPDILFPPQLNPMTGEWETILPDVFDPKKGKLAKKKEETKQEALKKTADNQNAFATKQPASLSKASKMSQKLIKESMSFVVLLTDSLTGLRNANEKNTPAPKTKPRLFLEEKKEKENNALLEITGSPSAPPLSENEIRRLIKKEVQKEIRKALPYEIRKHNEENQGRLFQNVFIVCGAWFFLMLMFSFS